MFSFQNKLCEKCVNDCYVEIRKIFRKGVFGKNIWISTTETTVVNGWFCRIVYRRILLKI